MSDDNVEKDRWFVEAPDPVETLLAAGKPSRPVYNVMDGKGVGVKELAGFVRSLNEAPSFVLDRQNRVVYGNVGRARQRGSQTTGAYVLDASWDTDRELLNGLREQLISQFGPDS